MANHTLNTISVTPRTHDTSQLATFKHMCFKQTNPNEADSLEFNYDEIIPMPATIMDAMSSSAILEWDELTRDTSVQCRDIKCGRRMIYKLLKLLDMSDKSTVGEALEALELKKVEPSERGSYDTLEHYQYLVNQVNLHRYNLAHFGQRNWYDWSLENWGVKWNAYYTQIEHDDDGGMVFNFCSPWGWPQSVYEKMVKMFPDLLFEIEVVGEFGEFAYNITTQGDDNELVCMPWTKLEIDEYFDSEYLEAA